MPNDTGDETSSDQMRYDKAGNQSFDGYSGAPGESRTYSYDAENRLKQAQVSKPSETKTTYYVYDADGHRTRRRRENGFEVWWQVYGVEGELVAEYYAHNGAVTMTAPMKEYGYRNGELLVIGRPGDVDVNTCEWLVTDQVGTPRLLVDQTGSLSGMKRHDYLPFGEELLAGMGHRQTTDGYDAAVAMGPGPEPRQQFVGYERDSETGLDFAQARYHASTQGRFTSVDPATESMKPKNPQSWNRYTYCLNNPLKMIDPTGLKPDDYYVDQDGTITIYRTQDNTDTFYVESPYGNYEWVAELARNDAGL